MALKQLMLRKKLSKAQEALEQHRSTNKFEEREAELTKALDEAKTDEEITVVEEEIAEFEKEKAEYTEQESTLQKTVDELQAEMDEIDANQPQPKEAEPAERSVQQTPKQEKTGGTKMKRNKFFGAMTRSEVIEFAQRDDVKDFVERSREFIEQKRAVKGAELTIPTIILDLLRDNLHSYSKLLKHITVKQVKGEARQTILGAIPEAVWTEMVGSLNELNLNFAQIEVDGYKVGGFVAVPKSTMDDSDVNLLSEIMNAIAQSIGLALDKAILYGKGAKMPVGIVTRLSEEQKPAYWGKSEKDWTDLRTKNLLLIEPTATKADAFFTDLVLKLGIVQSNYSNGNLFWAMNSKTAKIVQAKSLNFNASGAIVATSNKELPVVGGAVELLDFIPDGVIIGGYGSLYLLVEREGASFESSEHAQFLKDNLVFKGTARYDGRPVFGEAFVAIQIGQKGGESAPKATDVTFAEDSAN